MDKKEKENISSTLTTNLPHEAWVGARGNSLLSAEDATAIPFWQLSSPQPQVHVHSPWQNSGQGRHPCWMTQPLRFSRPQFVGQRELPRSHAEVCTLSVASQEGGGARFCIRQRMIVTNKLTDYHLTHLSQSYFLGHHRHFWLVLCVYSLATDASLLNACSYIHINTCSYICMYNSLHITIPMNICNYIYKMYI